MKLDKDDIIWLFCNSDIFFQRKLTKIIKDKDWNKITLADSEVNDLMYIENHGPIYDFFISKLGIEREDIVFTDHPTIYRGFILDPKYKWTIHEDEPNDQTILIFEK